MFLLFLTVFPDFSVPKGLKNFFSREQKKTPKTDYKQLADQKLKEIEAHQSRSQWNKAWQAKDEQLHQEHRDLLEKHIASEHHQNLIESNANAMETSTKLQKKKKEINLHHQERQGGMSRTEKAEWEKKNAKLQAEHKELEGADKVAHQHFHAVQEKLESAHRDAGLEPPRYEEILK